MSSTPLKPPTRATGTPGAPKRSLTAATRPRRIPKPVTASATPEQSVTATEATEKTVVVTTVVTTQTAVPERLRTHPPFFWRRWSFLFCAVFNLLLILCSLLGIPFTYGTPPPRQGTSMVAMFLVRLLFYAALGLAAVANVAIGSGMARQSFRCWLHITLACTLFVGPSVVLSQAFRTLSTGDGYSEPLAWALLVIYQFSTIMSAYDVDPPPRFAVITWMLRRDRAGRWRRAAEAFWLALHLDHDHAPPESG